MKFALALWLSSIVLIHAETLKFKEILKEIHAPADVKKVAADFEFTNASGKNVTVARFDATCSCIAVTIKDSKLQYAPGESGVIRAEFDMGNFSGTVDKVVAIWLDKDPEDKPSLSLTVRVHIPVLVVVEPKTLKWEIDAKPEPQKFQISMNHNKPIHVTSVESSSPAFKYELKTIEDGKSYEITVTPLKIDAASLAVMRIETDCELPKHRHQQAFAVIRKPAPAEAGKTP